MRFKDFGEALNLFTIEIKSANQYEFMHFDEASYNSLSNAEIIAKEIINEIEIRKEIIRNKVLKEAVDQLEGPAEEKVEKPETSCNLEEKSSISKVQVEDGIWITNIEGIKEYLKKRIENDMQKHGWNMREFATHADMTYGNVWTFMTKDQAGLRKIVHLLDYFNVEYEMESSKDGNVPIATFAIHEINE